MKCEICGKDFKHLGLHIKNSHNIDKKQYYITYIKNDKCFSCSKNLDEDCIYCDYTSIQNLVKCPICNKYIKNLGHHVQFTHKNYTQQEFYDKYLKQENEGICKYCGKSTAFIGIYFGYKEYCDKICLSKSKEKIDTRPIIHNCKLCGYGAISYTSLGHHLKNEHNLKTKDYYDMYFKQSQDEGKCKTCGKETKFNGFNAGGYAPYCSLKCANSNKDKCEATVQKIRNKNNGGWVQIPEESKKMANDKRHDSLIKRFGEDYGHIIAEKGKEKQKQTKANWTNEKKQEVKDKRQQTNIEKYGVANVLLLDENKQKANINKHSPEANEKRKETCRKHYGVDWQFQSKEVQEKIKQSNLEHFGVEWSLQAQEIRDKIRATSLERYGTTAPHSFGSIQFTKDMMNKYGVENAMYSPEFKAKMQETYINNNGGLWGASSIVQEKMQQTSLEKYGTLRPQESKEVQDKIKQTNIERFGVDCVFKSDEIKNKIKDTTIQKYGVDNVQKLPEIKEKSSQTYKENYKQNKQLDNEINDADE